MRCRAIPQPAIELGLVLELLAPLARHRDKARFHLRQGGHIHPQLFKLADGEDVFLAVSPALLTSLMVM